MPNPFFTSHGYDGQIHRPDNLKVTKSALKFGPLTVGRGNTVPPMDYGRPGDLILIDNTDVPSTILQNRQLPVSVGLWMKLPLSAPVAPAGNTIAGYPYGTATAGDVLLINGQSVTLSAPYTPAQVATDINAVGIPNIVAQAVADVLVISHATGGAITVTDSVGTATVTLGIYSQESLSQLAYLGTPANGVWMPVGYVAGSGTTSSPAAAQYLTLIADAGLPNARVFTAGTAVTITDGGNTLTVDHDIIGVGGLSDPLVGTDSLLVYNQSSTSIERATVSDVVAAAGGVAATVANQQRNVLLGTAGSYNIGAILPAGAFVRAISLEITSAYSVGTLIDIGDAGLVDRLMTNVANDPLAINTYTTVANVSYIAATQIIATITGAPTAGAARVIVDYIIP